MAWRLRFVNTRAHPFDLVFVRTVSVVPLLALYLTLGTFWAFVIHANLNWRLGWLEHVIVSCEHERDAAQAQLRM